LRGLFGLQRFGCQAFAFDLRADIEELPGNQDKHRQENCDEIIAIVFHHSILMFRLRLPVGLVLSITPCSAGVRLLRPFLSVGFGHPLGERGDQSGKRRGKRIPARDHHIVMSGLEWNPCHLPHDLPEASAHAVALDRVALLLRHGETDAGGLVGSAPIKGLEQEIGAAQRFPFCTARKSGRVLSRPGFMMVSSCATRS
jgi:hypothetical protein